MPQDRALNRKIGRVGLVRVALGATMAAAVVCSYASLARAADDGQSFSDQFMNTLGLKNPWSEEYGINYSERSPLVVPPTRNLPPPVSAGPPPAPNWPKDPDITKREAAKKAEKPAPHVDWASESDRVLRPNELNVPGAGTKVAAPGTPEQSSPPPGAKKSIFSFDWLSPKKEEYATFTGEPARTSLTDPPPGYLTPSPDQPYGIGPEHVTPHVQTVGERMEPTR